MGRPCKVGAVREFQAKCQGHVATCGWGRVVVRLVFAYLVMLFVEEAGLESVENASIEARWLSQ